MKYSIYKIEPVQRTQSVLRLIPTQNMGTSTEIKQSS